MPFILHIHISRTFTNFQENVEIILSKREKRLESSFLSQVLSLEFESRSLSCLEKTREKFREKLNEVKHAIHFIYLHSRTLYKFLWDCIVLTLRKQIWIIWLFYYLQKEGCRIFKTKIHSEKHFLIWRNETEVIRSTPKEFFLYAKIADKFSIKNIICSLNKFIFKKNQLCKFRAHSCRYFKPHAFFLMFFTINLMFTTINSYHVYLQKRKPQTVALKSLQRFLNISFFIFVYSWKMFFSRGIFFYSYRS